MIELLQWPAMLATVIASYLVASHIKSRRNQSFYWFIAGNVLWVIWGWQDHAYGLIALQVCLAALNLRGMWKTD